MASLVIRDLDDNVKQRLRERAAINGHSMEQEARELIAAGVRPRGPRFGLGTWMHELLTAEGGVDLLIPERSDEARLVDFDQ